MPRHAVRVWRFGSGGAMSGVPPVPGRPAPGAPGSVRPGLALVIAVIGFAALMIAGLGFLSLATNADIIAARGFGDLAGLEGGGTAMVLFALVLWTSLRRAQPSFWGAAWAGAAAFLGYLIAIGVGGAIRTADPVLAASVVGRLITAGFALVVLGAGLVMAWIGIALVRTRRGRPRWPWESPDEP